MNVVDFHIHTAPSLLPRRHQDAEIAEVLEGAGVNRFVMKAHEGSTAERAQITGDRAVGGVVLNSPVGGANPDAVRVAAALGARVVWMPTVSAETHIRGKSSPELDVHQTLAFSAVPVFDGHRQLIGEWVEVLDVVADHDLLLASGHLSMDETVALFEIAAARGVQRLLVNHPFLPFLDWRAEHVEAFRALGAYLEVGVLTDHLVRADEAPTVLLARDYEESLLVFGSDLGHTDFPEIRSGITDWLRSTELEIGARALRRIAHENGEELLAP